MAKKTASPQSTPAHPSPNVPIVAIGASAGGQEAVVELLKNLSPTTGLAYVYIQHLDPTQESRLVDILGRVTTMVVREAQHLMRVEANHLYVIPPDRDLAVLDGVLTLQPRQPRSVLHMPIDQFFLSLAERQKEGAIAVVLSGTASDGTLGLRAIKAAGGITFAQDETARFQSMPRSAIVEGVVDRVLPPTGIARELERLSEQVSLFAQTTLTETQEVETLETLLDEPTAAASEDLRTIIQLLRRATGVDFSHYKVTTIRRRIIRRTLLYKLDSLRAYAEYLRQHPEEASQLYDDLLINVTTFFRDADTMDYLQKVLLPQLVRDKAPAEPIRIWVPACSTGQEAYSIAMLLLEVLGERSLSRPIQLFATDLSESAVTKARLGSYTRSEMMDVSPRRLQRFFTKVDDHYRINKAVRDLCVFAPHNLLKDPPFSRLDLISCRNLLIYLDATLQRKAIVTFHYALNPNGYLVLGKSETAGASAQLFAQLEKAYKIFSRKNDIDSRVTFTLAPRQLDGDPGAGRPPGSPKPIGAGTGETAMRTQPLDQERLSGSDLDKAVDNLLLNQYIPASVVVTQDMEILQFRGSTGLFLEPSPGKASLNLIRMARPALVFELRNAIHKAQKSGEPVRKSGLEFKVRTKTHYAAIEAVPLDTATEERLFLIIFQEMDSPTTPVTQSSRARSKRINELETELANLREDMRSIIEEQEASNEELQSANEEIISSNEELQSINEELETSKEEIESTNEELLTINQELQVRNDQLSEAYQFAEDIFSTIREATLVLDTDLRIKSANPAFYRLFQLTEGLTERRLLYELGNRQWDIPELRLMLIDINTSGVPIQGYEMRYESSEVGGKWLSLNARRVVRQQDSILLAIEDITERRQAQQLLAEREAWFHQIADNAPTLIWVTDADGRFTFLNKVWLDYTGRSLDEVTKNGWVTSLHPGDRSAYQAIYTQHVKIRQPFNADYRLHRHDGDYRWMQENAQPMFSPDGTFTGFIGSSADVHLQHELNQELDRRVRERTEELERSYSTIQRMLDGSIAAVCLLESVRDETGTIVDFTFLKANRTSEIINQKTEAELQGKRLLAEFPGVRNVFFEDYKQVVETGSPMRVEQHYPYEHYGEDTWFDVSAVKNDDGFIMTFVDITQRKRTEKEIRKNLALQQQTAENLQVVLNSSLAAIGFLKPLYDGQAQITDFRLVVCNQEFAQVTGRTVDELTGSLATALAGVLWQAHTIETIRRVLETGEPYQEERLYEETGVWMLIRLTQYDGGAVLTGQDITALKRAELQQEQRLNELEKSDENLQTLGLLRQHIRERGEFLRSTSHDLRGNFGIIQGAATLLDMAGSDEERAQMLSMLQRNLQQATHMLTELLDVARLEAGQEERHLDSFDVAELLRSFVESVRPIADEKGLWLRTEGEGPLVVESDRVKSRRIVQNLTLNALKYTQTGGVTVAWGAAPDAHHWWLTIADTGPGLPEEVRSTSGEGIGLLITRQLVELLNGRIEVDSQQGIGTRFTLTFPRHYPVD